MQEAVLLLPHPPLQPILAHSCVLLSSDVSLIPQHWPWPLICRQGYVSGYLFQGYPKRPKRNQEAGLRARFLLS